MNAIVEKRRIKLENRIRLEQAATVLRGVLPGYGIEKDELQQITKPLAEKLQQLYEHAEEDVALVQLRAEIIRLDNVVTITSVKTISDGAYLLALREGLPKIRERLKHAYFALGGEEI